MEPLTEYRDFESVEELRHILHTQGCRICSLGFQSNINGCCVARGTPDKGLMIVGEAPGKTEDSTREPFTGPAGQLLDEIWTAAGMSTADWYITNVVLCRPVAPRGSGKQNLTPKVDQMKRCRWYLFKQLHLVQPKILVALGRPATEALLGIKSIRMGDYRGLVLRPDENLGLSKETTLFPMLHPAAILHSSGTPRYDEYRVQTWNDVQKLKKLVDQLQSRGHLDTKR